MRRGSNLHALGGFNQTVVFDTIRRAVDGLSRVEIAQKTGLSAQTVSNVARRLLDSGAIREAGIQNLGVGKPRTILQLDPAGHFAIGVHIDPAVITYVLLNIAGDVLFHAAAHTPSAADPDAVIMAMRDSINTLIVDSGVDRGRVLGVGIASPGPIDVEQGIVLDPPLLPHWHGVALRRELEKATGFFVLLEKDVTAAAVAELWKNQEHERDDFLFFYYGTGVGAGLVLGGEALRGPTSNAGDVGHVVVDTNGPVCRCGRTGCLGDAVSPEAIVQAAFDHGLLDASPDHLDAAAIDGCFTRLAALADSGDPTATGLLEGVARHLASAIVTLANLLDLSLIVFGGPYWAAVSRFMLERLPHLVEASASLVTTRPLVVVTSAIGDDVAAVGAACLVLDATLTPRSSTLFIA